MVQQKCTPEVSLTKRGAPTGDAPTRLLSLRRIYISNATVKFAVMNAHHKESKMFISQTYDFFLCMPSANESTSGRLVGRDKRKSSANAVSR